MPNGDDRNWDRLCGTIDLFREKYGRWPDVVRIQTACYLDLVSHLLSPVGYALVTSFVDLAVKADGYGFTAVGEPGQGFADGGGEDEQFPDPGGRHSVHVRAAEFFGLAVFRDATKPRSSPRGSGRV